MFRQQINVDRAVSNILKTDMSLRGAVPFFEIPYPTLKDWVIITKTQKALRNEITIKWLVILQLLDLGGGTKGCCQVERMQR